METSDADLRRFNLAVITSIEQHVEWIADTIKDLDNKGIKTIEATEEAQNGWVGHVNMVGAELAGSSASFED